MTGTQKTWLFYSLIAMLVTLFLAFPKTMAFGLAILVIITVALFIHAWVTSFFEEGEQ